MRFFFKKTSKIYVVLNKSIWSCFRLYKVKVLTVSKQTVPLFMTSHFALLFNTIHILHKLFYPIQLKPTLVKKVGYNVESLKKKKRHLKHFFLT